MLKNLLLAFAIVITILAGGMYYIYANRDIIAQKAANYAMETIVKQFDSKQNPEQQTWLNSFINSHSNEIKKALTDAAIEKGLDYFAKSSSTTKTAKNTHSGLATFADMFVNGTGNENTSDTQRLASAFISALGKNVLQNQATSDTNQAGHDINARDNKGRTLLMNVCRTEVSVKILNMLLKYGADINAQDNDGRTALMYAASLQPNIDIINFLAEHGADFNLLDKNSHSVLDYAKTEEIKNYIKKKLYANSF